MKFSATIAICKINGDFSWLDIRGIPIDYILEYKYFIESELVRGIRNRNFEMCGVFRVSGNVIQDKEYRDHNVNIDKVTVIFTDLEFKND